MSGLIPAQDKKAWLGLSKLGSAGRSPLPPGRTERLWDADQEAVVRPAPPPPALSGLPGWELDPFLCAGARERELRPPVWEQGGQRGSWAAAPATSGSFPILSRLRS